MDITLEQYINNPQLKSNAVLNATAREAIRANYKERFDALMVREKGIINYRAYYDAKRNRVFVHFKIPSETVERFYYDVVFEFFANSDVTSTENIFKYFVKFYSNDPAFVFTYAHSFLDNNLLIDELKSKMSRKAIKEKADEKNPYNQIGYVKTIYFAYLYMQERGIGRFTALTSGALTFSVSAIQSSVQNADEKVENRIAAGDKLNKLKKAKERKERPVPQNATKMSTAIGTTKHTSTINRQKNFTKTTKTTKRKK